MKRSGSSTLNSEEFMEHLKKEIESHKNKNIETKKKYADNRLSEINNSKATNFEKKIIKGGVIYSLFKY
jgi:hypothetical protein